MMDQQPPESQVGSPITAAEVPINTETTVVKEDTIEGKGKQRKPKATSVVPRKTKKTISKETKKKQPGKPDKPGKPQTGFDEYI